MKMKISREFEGQEVIITTKYGKKIAGKVISVGDKEMRILSDDEDQVISYSIVAMISRRRAVNGRKH